MFSKTFLSTFMAAEVHGVQLKVQSTNYDPAQPGASKSASKWWESAAVCNSPPKWAKDHYGADAACATDRDGNPIKLCNDDVDDWIDMVDFDAPDLMSRQLQQEYGWEKSLAVAAGKALAYFQNPQCVNKYGQSLGKYCYCMSGTGPKFYDNMRDVQDFCGDIYGTLCTLFEKHPGTNCRMVSLCGLSGGDRYRSETDNFDTSQMQFHERRDDVEIMIKSPNFPDISDYYGQWRKFSEKPIMPNNPNNGQGQLPLPRYQYTCAADDDESKWVYKEDATSSNCRTGDGVNDWKQPSVLVDNGCNDNKCFKDAQGWGGCTDWSGYCSSVSDIVDAGWGYTKDQARDILANCPTTCGSCHTNWTGCSDDPNFYSFDRGTGERYYCAAWEGWCDTTEDITQWGYTVQGANNIRNACEKACNNCDACWGS